jgi:predicted small lipoprotein YifL
MLKFGHFKSAENNMRLAFLPVLLALLVQGCGIKGPLYLPPPGAPGAKAPEAQSTPKQPQQEKSQ